MSDKKLKEIPQERIEKEKMWDFFLSIWEKIPWEGRICRSCEKRLADEPRSYYFDHLLEKESYPHLKFEEANIFICCLECHSLKTGGHPTEVHQQAIDNYKNSLLT